MTPQLVLVLVYIYVIGGGITQWATARDLSARERVGVAVLWPLVAAIQIVRTLIAGLKAVWGMIK